jgi:hypothetical protein
MVFENFDGRVGHLTPDQEEAFAQFKALIKEEGFYNSDKHDDHLLLRFLRARKFDLAATKEMWINCQNWRVSYGTDTVKDSTDEVDSS